MAFLQILWILKQLANKESNSPPDNDHTARKTTITTTTTTTSSSISDGDDSSSATIEPSRRPSEEEGKPFTIGLLTAASMNSMRVATRKAAAATASSGSENILFGGNDRVDEGYGMTIYLLYSSSSRRVIQ